MNIRNTFPRVTCVGGETSAHAQELRDRQNELTVDNTRGERGISSTQYAVQVGDLQWVRIPSGQSVARPEATRAAKEVTNALKYSGKGHLG